MGVAVFGDLAPVEHLESVALEDFGAAPPLEGDDLSVDLTDALPAEMIEIEIHEALAVGESLRLGKDVEVEVGGAARCLWNLAPGVA